MKDKKFASFLAAAAALVLLAMPAFAADEQTELPAAEAAEVQQEQTAAPAEQETALPADAQTAGEPEQQLTYVALGDSITSGVGLADMKYNIAQIGYDLQPNFEGYPSQCYTALVGKGLGLDRQHAINLGLPGLMSPDMLDMVQNSAMPKMNQASGAYYVYPEYQEYLRKADIISIQIGSNDALARKHGLVTDFGKFADPVADKILTMSAFVCFVALGWADAALVIIILAREFIVTSIRLVAAGGGKVIAANLWGKAKTVSQIFAILLVLALQAFICGFDSER